ncbi:MAG: M36 family metallopeptidase [Myxococcales bacterium]|nr:M36 family metallopeptidase [Myxococcales bacterium]
MAAANATAAARQHVERLAPAWGVRSDGLPTLETLGEIRVPGGTVVRMRQVIDGIPVASAAGGEVRVMVAKDNSMIATSGKLISRSTPHARSPKFVDNDAGAVARAVTETYKTSFAPTFAPSALATHSVAKDGTRLFSGQTGSVQVEKARARKAWVPEAKGLTAAWVVEAYTSNAKTTSGDLYRTVIAADGRVLSRTNLTADEAYRYRVFADDTGALIPFDGPIVDPTPHASGVPSGSPFPGYVLPKLVTVDGLNHPDGGEIPDSWLDSGATETVGNNVDAYLDIAPPTGLTFGDFRATVSKPATATTIAEFDRVYDTAASALSSQDQQMAGITSLFYIINWMHDFWYDGGFTEAAGNGQDSNFGRGGEDRDSILAETQDCATCTPASRNNANMGTPSDGLNPRMQVFVWTNDKRSLKAGALDPSTGTAAFGATTFDLTAGLVIANDGVVLPAPAGTVTDGCTALTAPATGKIVVVDRGSCSFKTKALVAQTAGAVGMILVNNADGSPPGLADDATITTPITVAVLSLSKADGTTLKTAIGAGAVSATMKRALGPELEGTLDASVISHEFGHYLHHRLTECNTTFCRAMSEGWADFSALLTLTRKGDDLDKAYPMAVYSTQGFAGDPVYFGIRRAPYSVNPAINGLTFKHMADETPSPTTFPFDAGGPNSEVHNGGEVWASMLWEGYVALQKAPGADFDEVLLKMRQYVVAGLLIAPPEATPLETRDAILAAVKAASPEDHDILAAAYARRGFGSCAVSPSAASVNFNGIIDSFDVKGQLVPSSAAIKEQTSCDSDQVLDAGETSRVTVEISNPGPVRSTGVTVTLASNNPTISVGEATVEIGDLKAYAGTSAVFYVKLASSVSAPAAIDLTASINAADGCGVVELPMAIRVNTDDAVATSATDNFDAGSSVWTPDEDTTEWSHIRKTPLDGAWHGADAGRPSDSSLTSPPLTAGSGALTATFTHRFSFEGTVDEAFDGGVIEISTDEGETWADISTVADPGYNVVITPGSTSISELPAYGAESEGYPETNAVTLDFGDKLAGKTFQLRFRVVSDPSAGGPGWDIDDLAFTGLEGKPFPTLVSNAKACNPDAGNPDDDDDDDGGCQSGRSTGAGTLAAFAVLGLLTLRRRRR